jgi:thiosulfate/3-mercaptopyruvate sulfurtransferase
MFRTLIDAEQFKTLRATNDNLVVFDCRHDLTDVAAGRAQYAQGHIPGAHFAHLDEDLSGVKTGKNGRHPLPDRTAFAAWLGKHGVGDTSQVICYDAAGGMYAARLWWMCRWVGIDTVAVLDGGWQAWLAAGGSSIAHVPAKRTAALTPRAPLVEIVTVNQVQENLRTQRFTLMDARAPERFRGEQEALDPVAGHIPGAINRFFKLNLREDGRFKSGSQLRNEFDATLTGNASANLVMTCGSGATACHNILALELAGLGPAPLYAGSWSEWCGDPKRPVAKGP